MSTELIAAALTLIQDKYIFPDKVAEIRQRIEAGHYEGLDEQALGERLTETLFDVTADRHLRIRTRAADMGSGMTEQEWLAAYRARLLTINFGIERVERLDGNVGLLELAEIPEAATGGDALAAAMGLVAHTEALVIDLRECRGGVPNGVHFLLSYFFPDDETHLGDIYDGATGTTRQYWSLAYLPGRRYLDRPVHVLTSGFTFSGAEDLAYTLQSRGRATVVGETTRGGAHPTEMFPLSATMEVTVPIARSISPVTGTNWEGTGVVPDVSVPAGEALAYVLRDYPASAR